jgi:hypothetical protein
MCDARLSPADDDIADETHVFSKKHKRKTEQEAAAAREAALLAAALEREPAFDLELNDAEHSSPAREATTASSAAGGASPGSRASAAAELRERYRHLLGDSGDQAAGRDASGGQARNDISVKEVVAAVVKHKSSTANAVKEALLADRKNYESLAFSDLGGEVDDVL